MLSLFLLLLLPAAEDNTKAPPKRPPELVAFTDQIRALPPEFSADLRLRLAGSSLISDPSWRKELIEEAFLAAAQAPLPYRQSGGVHTDTRPSREAWNNGLEQLTLQTRAVEDLLPLDPTRATALFTQLRIGTLPQPDCQVVLVPHVTDYYDAAGKVLKTGFTPAQRRKGEDALLLETALQRLQSPVEVLPAARLLASATWLNEPARSRLLTVFVGALDRIPANSRTFTYAQWGLTGSVLSSLRPLGLEQLIPAWRTFLVRQLQARRCTDQNTPAANGLPGTAAKFNSMVAKVPPSGPGFAPLTPEEVQPVATAGTFTLTEYWQSGKSRRILQELKWLNHGNRKLPDDQRFWTLSERETPEWQEHYATLLQLLEDWSEDDEPSAGDYFSMRAGTYASLARLIPPGPARTNMLRTYRTFLEQEYGRLQNRNLWFTEVALFLHAGQRTSSGGRDTFIWILDELVRSENPVLSAYARMEQLAPAR